MTRSAKLAPLGDEAGEPGEGILHHVIGDFPGLVRERLVGRGLGLEFARLDLLHLDAERFEQLRDFRPLEDDADRAGDGVAARDDMVGGDGGDVAAGCRDRVHDGGHRLVLGDLADLLIDRFGAGGRAAGAVDADDHALDAIRFRDFLEKIEGRLVAGDQAEDFHAGDVIGLLVEIAAAPEERAEGQKTARTAECARGSGGA